MNKHLMSNYAPLPLTFDRGDGAWLWDTHGKRYLDSVSGIAVCGLGHAHPAVTAAIRDQAGKLLHTSNLYGIAAQEALAERLCSASEMDSAFFCNSGAEANEAAIKIARLYGHGRGIASPTIIVMENSFHGRTMATLTATGNRKVQAGFEPLLGGFTRAPYNEVNALETIAANNRDVVAILLEPAQGEGGVRIPDAGYLAEVRGICDANGWLMMLDEVQTGMGRTGKWFGWQHEDARPDVMALAKALGNGVPVGACVARDQAARVFGPGSHGSTFGGNPLACRAALAVIDVIEGEALCERAAKLGNRFMDGLTERLGSLPGVVNVRGKGLMLGVELESDCAALVRQAIDAGLLINVTSGNVIRLLPPLIISDEQADLIIDGVSTLVERFVELPVAERA
ncbi:MAG: aspartate aminotransferase family protein [Pseudomonadota bacterium]|nr:aspartate aminotransferase family protein [Pseudomonadota bacterium]